VGDVPVLCVLCTVHGQFNFKSIISKNTQKLNQTKITNYIYVQWLAICI